MWPRYTCVSTGYDWPCPFHFSASYGGRGRQWCQGGAAGVPRGGDTILEVGTRSSTLARVSWEGQGGLHGDHRSPPRAVHRMLEGMG